MAKRRARPTKFSAAIAATICARLAAGETLRAICRDPSLPGEETVRRWAVERQAFAAELERAREIGYTTLADELLEIADDSAAGDRVDAKGRRRSDAEAIRRSRLRIETRKWLLARTVPQVRGGPAGRKKNGGGASLEALVLASLGPTPEK